MKASRVIYVDIDGVLCTQDPEHPSWYKKALPIKENIKKVNELYDEGHTIILWTARGCISQIDYYDFTFNQMTLFGVKFHKLRCDKPYYDEFIDDRARPTI